MDAKDLAASLALRYTDEASRYRGALLQQIGGFAAPMERDRLSAQQFTRQLQLADFQAVRQRAALNAAKFARMDEQEREGKAVAFGYANPDLDPSLVPDEFKPFMDSVLKGSSAAGLARGRRAAAEKPAADAAAKAATRLARSKALIAAAKAGGMDITGFTEDMDPEDIRALLTARGVSSRAASRLAFDREKWAARKADIDADNARGDAAEKRGDAAAARAFRNSALAAARKAVADFELEHEMKRRIDEPGPNNTYITRDVIDVNGLSEEAKGAYNALKAERDRLSGMVMGGAAPAPVPGVEAPLPSNAGTLPKAGGGTRTTYAWIGGPQGTDLIYTDSPQAPAGYKPYTFGGKEEAPLTDEALAARYKANPTQADWDEIQRRKAARGR